MAEQIVKIEGVVPVSSPAPLQAEQSGTWNVGITGQPLSQYAVANPALTGVYVFSAANLAGVVAANTFLTLFNPIGSGKTVSFSAAFVSTVSTAAAGTTAPMRGYRIAAAPSGGSVQGAATIAKFNNANADSVVEVRLGNPTVVLGAALWNTPPAVTAGVGGGQFVHSVDTPEGSPPFVLAPGEGIAIHCAGGDADQIWNLTVVWAES